MNELPYWIPSTVDGKAEGRYTRNPGTPDEVYFCNNKHRATLIAEGSGNEAYEYDDWALCELDGKYYLFNTSGCSCPSPETTWSLEMLGTREEMQTHFNQRSAEYNKRAADTTKRRWWYVGNGHVELVYNLHKVWPLDPPPPERGQGTDW